MSADQDEFNFDAPPKKDASEVAAPLLDKIKKLLRLASSSNPHEASLAMSRAMALADRANLDLTSLSEDDDVGAIIQRWIPVGSRLTSARRLALGIVQAYFHVKPVIVTRSAGKQVVFIGTESDIAIAEYVFAFLARTCRSCLKEYEVQEKKGRRRMSSTKRASFMGGFFYGISDQLNRRREKFLMEDHKFAIVLSDKEKSRDDFARNALPNLRAGADLKETRKNYSAIQSGWHDGKRTSLNPAFPNQRGHLALK